MRLRELGSQGPKCKYIQRHWDLSSFWGPGEGGLEGEASKRLGQPGLWAAWTVGPANTFL